MAFLADLVASYHFEKAKANFYPTTYHGIYIYDVLVVLKGKNMPQDAMPQCSYLTAVGAEIGRAVK